MAASPVSPDPGRHDGEPDQALLLGETTQPGREPLGRDPGVLREHGPVRLVEHALQHDDVAAAALVGHPGRQVHSPAEVVELVIGGHRDRRAVVDAHLE
jgi:hypothetical protein